MTRIRRRHWLLALSFAALAHAALVAAINPPRPAARPSPAIVINLGEMGAPKDAPGAGSGSAGGEGEPAPAEQPRTPIAETSPAPPPPVAPEVPVVTREIPRPRTTHAPVKPKPKPEQKPEQKPERAREPQIAKAPRHRPDRKQPTQTAVPLTDAGPQAASGARAPGRDASNASGRGTGTGIAGRGGDIGGSSTGAGRGGGGGKGIANYPGRLAAWLNRHKRYPDRARRLRQEGTVRVTFTLDRAGRLLSQRIAGGSGHPLLDQEVQAMVNRANPMPAFPPGMTQNQLTVTVPVNFSLR